MTTAVETKDYSQFVGKKVTLTRNTTDENNQPIAVEIIGKLENANALGVLIKPTGRSAVELIEIGEIEDVIPEPEAPKKIAVKYLKKVMYGQARNHLLERHAATLTEVNAMSEDDAFKLHEGIDHVAADLGHVHGEKPAEEVAAEGEAAPAEAEQPAAE